MTQMELAHRIILILWIGLLVGLVVAIFKACREAGIFVRKRKRSQFDRRITQRQFRWKDSPYEKIDLECGHWIMTVSPWLYRHKETKCLECELETLGHNEQ